jgi:hypothetical protein
MNITLLDVENDFLVKWLQKNNMLSTVIVLMLQSNSVRMYRSLLSVSCSNWNLRQQNLGKLSIIVTEAFWNRLEKAYSSSWHMTALCTHCHQTPHIDDTRLSDGISNKSYVEFVVGRVVLGQIFSKYFGLPRSFLFQQQFCIHHSSRH